jgi:pimeloyl-ACP methyl ester carboxylesterase
MKIKSMIVCSFLSVLCLILITSCSVQTPLPTPVASAEPTQPSSSVIQPEATSIEAPTPVPTAEPLPTDTPEPSAFEETTCKFELPNGLVDGKEIQCGVLSVPINRSDPESPTTELSIAILAHTSEGETVQPVIYLEGGPGGSALEYLYLTYDSYYKPFTDAGYDIILLDQRGVGFTEPTLDCPTEDKLFYDLLDNEIDGQTYDEQQMNDLTIEALSECAVDLNQEVDLSNYNTDANAADVDDLRQALGYEKWNLWGVSYGTRLGLEIMRDYPAGIRSVILDSTYPPDVDLYSSQPDNVARVLDVFFNGCVADAVCNETYPELEKLFYETVDRWNQEPVAFMTTDFINSDEYEVVIDGENFIDLLFQFMYSTETIPILPKLITDASQGKFEDLALLMSSIISTQDAISDGMHWTFQCTEELAFSTPADMATAAAKYPEFGGLFDQQSIELPFEVCAAFDVPQAPADANQPVSSDLPVLVMAGEYDPVTPPAWGEQAASTLSNSFYFEYPGYGHGSSMSEGCPRDMAIAFFADPTQSPDAACISSMAGPQFVVPFDVTSINMVEVVNEEMGIQGLMPEGWEEINTGVYARGTSDLDPTVALAQAGALSADDLLNTFSNSFQLSESPKLVGTREFNGLTWSLYAFTSQGFTVEMAITDSGSLGIVVLVQTSADEHDGLYDTVYLPMVESTIPIP